MTAQRMPTGVAWLFGVVLLPAAIWFAALTTLDGSAVGDIPAVIRLVAIPIVAGSLTAWSWARLARLPDRQRLAMALSGGVLTPFLPWIALFGYLLLGGDLGFE